MVLDLTVSLVASGDGGFLVECLDLLSPYVAPGKIHVLRAARRRGLGIGRNPSARMATTHPDRRRRLHDRGVRG